MADNQAMEWERPGRDAAAACLGEQPDGFKSPLTVLASPAWRGVEGAVWRASAGDQSVIVKRYHDDVGFYVDFIAVAEAAEAAAEAGIGPRVLLTEASNKILVLEDLKAPWRAGGLQDAKSAPVRSNVIAAKKAYQAGVKLGQTRSIFDEIDNLYSVAASSDVGTHNDITVFKEFFDDARAKISSLGQDCVACHRDGNTANLMVGDDNAVTLIDFDLAANCDPFEDIGCYLQEFCENEADARLGFEEWYGSFDEGLFQRAMVYGLADDMRWGLIASIMGATSPRGALEFTKYAAWRFLRLEAGAKRSDAFNRIRIAA